MYYMTNINEYTDNTHTMTTTGRSASQFSLQLKKWIKDGTFPPGAYLPPVRELSKKHVLACSTVHRALKGLAQEGLLLAEPRQGYRVRAGANDPSRGFPIAYVFSQKEDPQPWGTYHQTFLTAFQQAANRRGWSLLATTASADRKQELLEQLRTSRTCGVVLDMNELDLISFFKNSGLPVIMVNSWTEDVQVDAVIQNGFQGGLLAARYLVDQGHKHIGWLGHEYHSAHSAGRLGGALAGLDRAGLKLPENLIFRCNEETALEAARKLLARPDRPTAVIALWKFCALAVQQAARELGVEVATVGWCVEEEYENNYRQSFHSGQVPPTVRWSATAMAEAALDRISARRSNEKLPFIRIEIPAALHVPQTQPVEQPAQELAQAGSSY